MAPDTSPGSASQSSPGSSAVGSAGTGRSGSGSGSGAYAEEGLNTSLCAFWLGSKCFALDTKLVGEVVTVEAVTPVPKSHAAVLGLFNLRGTPVALVDLSAVLELSEAAAAKEVRTALVLKSGGLMAAALIDRMEAVIPVGRGRFSPREGGEEDPVVQGFLEVSLRGGIVLTVFDAAKLLERIEALKYR